MAQKSGLIENLNDMPADGTSLTKFAGILLEWSIPHPNPAVVADLKVVETVSPAVHVKRVVMVSSAKSGVIVDEAFLQTV